ncbi:MAG: DUF7344 domain-containing protein [Halohasta sp.]
MTFHWGTRAEGSTDDGSSDGREAGGGDTDERGGATISADQRREWRRWIVETFLDAQYGVVPVDHLVDAVVEREPDSVDRSAVRAGLVDTVLPGLDADGILEYDADRAVVVDYGP